MLSSFKRDYLQAEGTRLHYYRTGRQGGRPVVLVHGFSDNGLCWTPTARGLAPDYDVIMPDMRGHGLSERARPGETADMAADVAALIRLLGLGSPVLVGHSMGAGIVYQVVSRFPALASALVLEDPPWWLSPMPEPDPPADNPIVAWAKTLPGTSMEDLLSGYRRDHPTWTDEFVRIMCESKKQLDIGIVDILGERVKNGATEWLTGVSKITQPTLMFTADPGLGAIVTPEVAAKVRELNPRIKTVHVPDAGHLIRFDRHDAFMDALRAFLRALPA